MATTEHSASPPPPCCGPTRLSWPPAPQRPACTRRRAPPGRTGTSPWRPGCGASRPDRPNCARRARSPSSLRSGATNAISRLLRARRRRGKRERGAKRSKHVPHGSSSRSWRRKPSTQARVQLYTRRSEVAPVARIRGVVASKNPKKVTPLRISSGGQSGMSTVTWIQPQQFVNLMGDQLCTWPLPAVDSRPRAGLRLAHVATR